MIGCLAVFFLVMKLGGTSDKNHPVHEFQLVPGYLEITVDHLINLNVKYQPVSSNKGSTRVLK